MASADTSTTITIEVAYALPGEQILLRLQVPRDCKLLEAVRLSGLPARFPEIDLAAGNFGVFGRKAKAPAEQVLAEGDRVEIYRSLLIDPKEARRARAEKAKAKRAQQS